MVLLVLIASAVASLALAAVATWRRRAALARLAIIERVADRLRDDVWRLEAAAEARDRAEAASEAKSRFLATVSHEVRTPLSGILGMADLLGGLDLGREAASYVEAIRASGRALGSLIDEILDFSRIEAGRLELENEAFDLVPLVEGVVELLAPRAQDKGLEIASLIEPGTPRTVRGDSARLRQILINLAGNAIKFTDAGGVGLRVSVDASGAIRFVIEDTGRGIAPERHAAVFEEFEQGDPAAHRAHDGAGLGLAISLRLAQHMGGALTLDHSTPSGSRFVLTLPLASEAARASHPSGLALRILVVARSPFEAPFLAERLAAAGATVVRVEGEVEALGILTGDRAFDAAIIDCALGEEGATRIAAATHRVGIARALVLLSPFERRMLAPGAWRAFDGWLVKPVRDASLQHCLEGRATSAPSNARPTPPARPLESLMILVAEDNDINALIAVRHLERAGAQVTRVADGASAVDQVASARATGAPYDAAVMDVRMPGLDGLGAVQRIRDAERENPGSPLALIAVSANAFEEDRTAAMAAGFDRFFVKPVDHGRLIETIVEMLERPLSRERVAAVISP